MLAEILVKYGVELDVTGTVNLVTPLWIASQNGHLEVMSSVLIDN